MINISNILRCFPNKIYSKLDEKFMNENVNLNYLEEIRIRVNRPILLKSRQADIIIDYNVTSQEVIQTLERICENSIYAYKNQMCEGFITVKGGHRIGITGTAVVENDKIINMKNITSLNFRIAREVIGCSNNLVKEIIDTQNNTMTCGVVDERGEIASIYKGVPQNDIGIRTDVVENISKSKGIKMLIRSMAPEVVACDEIGSKEDILSIKEMFISGVKGIFTMHRKNNGRYKSKL